MFTYVLGPSLAFLPRRWRKVLAPPNINWAHAAALSGAAEFLLMLIAGAKWYFYSMGTWIARGLDVALRGEAGPGITDQAIGGMAWFMWANHPLTWALGYFAVEGAIRFCGAAFGESYLGTLPLFFVDKVFAWIWAVPPEDPDRPAVAASFVNAVSEKLLESTQPAGADEIIEKTDGADQILEIRASRKKPDWDPPRVVRIADSYYRLENFSKGVPPRPFRYTLRRLAAGVPGRKVLVYDADPAALAAPVKR